MSVSVLYMSMSLDGYIAGPNDEPGNPGGDGFDRLHEWFETPDGEFGQPAGPKFHPRHQSFTGHAPRHCTTPPALVWSAGVNQPKGDESRRPRWFQLEGLGKDRERADKDQRPESPG